MPSVEERIKTLENTLLRHKHLGDKTTTLVDYLKLVSPDYTENELAQVDANKKLILRTLAQAGIQAQDAFLDDIAALVDPNADRILFWDDSAGAFKFLSVGAGLTISGTEITASGGWEELGKATLASAATTLSVDNLTAREHLYIIVIIPGFAANDRPALRFNDDSGNNYNFIGFDDFALNANSANKPEFIIGDGVSTAGRYETVSIRNLAAEKKRVNSAGQRYERKADNQLGEWANTVDQITKVTLLSVAGNNMDADTKLIVYGRD